MPALSHPVHTPRRQPKTRTPIRHRHRRQTGNLHRRPTVTLPTRRRSCRRSRSILPRSRHPRRTRYFLLPASCFLFLPAMNIDNQPIRIRQQKRRVFRHMMHIQHHPRHIVAKLRRPHPFQETIIGYPKTLPLQLRRQPRMPNIKEDPVRILHPRGLILHFLTRRHIQINRHPRVARRRPVPNPGHLRRRPRLPLHLRRNHPPGTHITSPRSGDSLPGRPIIAMGSVASVTRRPIHRLIIPSGSSGCPTHLSVRPIHRSTPRLPAPTHSVIATRPGAQRRRTQRGIQKTCISPLTLAPPHHTRVQLHSVPLCLPRIILHQLLPNLSRLLRILRPQQRQRPLQRHRRQPIPRISLRNILILPHRSLRALHIPQLPPHLRKHLPHLRHRSRRMRIARVPAIDRPKPIHHMLKLRTRMHPLRLSLKPSPSGHRRIPIRNLPTLSRNPNYRRSPNPPSPHPPATQPHQSHRAPPAAAPPTPNHMDRTAPQETHTPLSVGSNP